MDEVKERIINLEVILSMVEGILLPVVLSLFLAYIAYQQMITNRHKLKLELYAKRFDVYSSSLKFYQELMSNELSKETHLDFISKKESAYFLFSDNEKVHKLLDEMHEKSFVINGFRETAEQLRHSQETFIKAQAESEAALTWFGSVMKRLRAELNPYMEFK